MKWNPIVVAVLVVMLRWSGLTNAQDRLAEVLPPEPALHAETENLQQLFLSLGQQYERIAETPAWQTVVEMLGRSDYSLAHQQVTKLPEFFQGPMADRLQSARQASLTVYRSDQPGFDYVILLQWEPDSTSPATAFEELLQAWDAEAELEELEPNQFKIRWGAALAAAEGGQVFAVDREPYSIISNRRELASSVSAAINDGAASTSLARNLRYRRVSRLHLDHPTRVYINPAELKRVLGLPEQVMKLEQGQVAAIGGGCSLPDDQRIWLKASASLALTTPTEGFFRGLQLTRPVATPPVNRQHVTAIQGLSFQWNDLFGFLETSLDTVFGRRFFRNQLEREGAYVGIRYDQVRQMFQAWNGSVFMGYLSIPDKDYYGMFYCYQLQDAQAAEKFVAQQIKVGNLNRSFPPKKHQVAGYEAWFRDEETLEKAQRQMLRDPKDRSEERKRFQVGSEALVIVDRWVIACPEGAIPYLVDEQSSTQKLGELDADLDRVIKDQSRGALPFCLRLVKPEHWKIKYAGTPPLTVDRGVQAPPNRSEFDEDSDPGPIQARPMGPDGRPRVTDEKLMGAFTHLFYDEFGGHVIAGYAQESFLKFEITAFAPAKSAAGTPPEAPAASAGN
jgi:hypothetical protein